MHAKGSRPEPQAQNFRAAAAGLPGDEPIHVLLVEDDAEAATVVRFSLHHGEQETFELEWSHNLTEAMQRVGQPGIDVVLLDLGLPEMSGYRCQRALEAASNYQVPMVILTGDDDGLSRDLVFSSCASAYLVKDETSPLQLRQELYRAVHEHRCAARAVRPARPT